MILKKKNYDIDFEMNEILSFKNDSEIDDFKVKMLQLKFMEVIECLMNESDMNKSDLSSKINKSKSFITQLFSTDKLLNLKTLTQLQDVFDVDFKLNYSYKKNNIEYTPCSPNVINFKKVFGDKKFKLEQQSHNDDFFHYVPQPQSISPVRESA